jgi:hypothetical protein
VQTDEQTEIDMETNMDVDIGGKFVYIYGPFGLEKIVNQQVSEASKVTALPAIGPHYITALQLPSRN